MNARLVAHVLAVADVVAQVEGGHRPARHRLFYALGRTSASWSWHSTYEPRAHRRAARDDLEHIRVHHAVGVRLHVAVVDPTLVLLTCDAVREVVVIRAP